MKKQMRRILSILLVMLFLLSLSVSAASVAEASKNIWKAYHAALDYEKKGQFDQALSSYNQFIDYATTLEEQAGENHWENLKSFHALKNHLTGTPELYVEASLPADAKYFGAKHEPRYGTYFGKCEEFYSGQESAFLLYVTIGSENIQDFAYMLPAEKGIYLELAWNVAWTGKESLDQVRSGALDNYLISNLKYMNTLDYKVLLRFCAEVNCWEMPDGEAERNALIESFKEAFRHVTTLARQYAPNVAMVYSPNDVSNWYVTVEDFYPGDEYVDWVGLSMYDDLSANATYERADGVEAYYFRGVYDNPIVKIKNVVEAFGDRKPIMVSECGFSYGGDGLQTEEHAVEQFKKFYSYVNMVYPQVKAVFYFNVDIDGLHKLSGSSRLKAAYNEITTKTNAGMAASLYNKQKGYTRFSTINENIDTLKLALYAEYPTGVPSDISYTLDGAGLPYSNTVPYTTSISVSNLSQGRHVLSVAVSNSGYYTSKDYEFFVGPDNFVTNSQAALDYYIATRPNITVKLKGAPISFSQQPILFNDSTLVPLRAIFEALNADVQWESATQTITAKKGSTTIKLQIDSISMTVNGREKILNAPAKLICGSTLVPVRAISEALNCQVGWDGATQTVTIEE